MNYFLSGVAVGIVYTFCCRKTAKDKIVNDEVNRAKKSARKSN